VLVVTKLDRLGRNSIDVQTTVKRLDEMGVRVHCLALGGVDLTSPAGKMTMGVIAAVAQFERDLLIERTLSGQARAPVRLDRPMRAHRQTDRPAGLSCGPTTDGILPTATSSSVLTRSRTTDQLRHSITIWHSRVPCCCSRIFNAALNAPYDIVALFGKPNVSPFDLDYIDLIRSRWGSFGFSRLHTCFDDVVEGICK
jgi:hypothetical protein